MVSEEFVNLKLLTAWESSDQSFKYIYGESWPGYDEVNFLKANEISLGLDAPFKQLKVKHDSSLLEVTEAARKVISEFDENFAKDCSGPEKWPVSYSLICPALGNDILSNSNRLIDLGITDDELIILKRVAHRSPGKIEARLAHVKSFIDFQSMVTTTGSPPQKGGYFENFEIYASLLYTDEDIELATYVRTYFDEIHRMSGVNVTVYVVEEPPKGSAYAASTFWKTKLLQRPS